MWILEKLYFSGDDFFNDLIEKIKKAKFEINLEFYIFKLDEIGKKIISELEKASQRGVRVRLIVDGVGSIESCGDLLALNKNHNFNVRVYHPIGLRIFLYFNFLNLLKLIQFLANVNKRNHRKCVIIDRYIAFSGGFNVMAENLESISLHKAWRDTGVQVIGREVKDVIFPSFLWVWVRSWEPKKRFLQRFKRIKAKKNFYSKLVRLNLFYRLRRRHFRSLIKRILNAKQEILITNPYFVPKTSLIWALKKAARRGVKIKIIVPKKIDVKIVRYASVLYYRELLESKIEIYEYYKTILHAKTIIIDDWAMVGSTNLNHRSFLHDLEIDIILKNQDSISLLKRQFVEDLKTAEKVVIKDLEERSFLEKILSKIIINIRYLL
jgi:cardiolipin synthase